MTSNTCSAVFLMIFFFFNDSSTTEIYTLSLHDALPIFSSGKVRPNHETNINIIARRTGKSAGMPRSEERFSRNAETELVCRLLLEKKNRAGVVSDAELIEFRTEVENLAARLGAAVSAPEM